MFAVVVVDELGSGVVPASAPDLARDLGVAPGLAAGVIIAAFHSLALLVETPLLAWADGARVRTVSSVALAVLGVATVLAGLATGPYVLFAALALYGPASGLAVAASEGLLVESRPDERERTMARLTLAGALGDLAVPALLAALAWVGLGWRVAAIVAGASALGLALVHARARDLDRPMAIDDDDEDLPPDALPQTGARPAAANTEPDGANGRQRPAAWRELLRTVRARPSLVLWALTGPAIGLLDEVLVAFSVVHLDLQLGATPLARSVAVAVWTVGGLVGLVVLERLLAARVLPLRLLACALGLLVPALVVLALARSVELAIVALAVVGAAGATLHPIAQARAYAALPGRPALVNAVGSLVAPLDLVLPLALAAVAMRFGSIAAVLALLVSPMVVAVAAVASTRARR